MTGQTIKDAGTKYGGWIRWTIGAGIAIFIYVTSLATEADVQTMVESAIESHERLQKVEREGLHRRLDRIEKGFDDLNSFLRKNKP